MIQLKIIEILKSHLSECFEIKSAILYGSFARQDANVNSDVDLAILINESFDVQEFINKMNNILSEFNILQILYIQLRNKIAIYFENIPKVEIALLSKIEDIKRNYHRSGIPSDLIDTTILFDKTKSIKSFLSELARNNKKQNIKPVINKLINKFIYEFESCSFNHFRSDGYKFYYFYNIAFHIAIQLRYLADGKTDFYFLPKNFLVKNITEKEEMYKLAGSTYLREANDKKRRLIDFFIISLNKLNYSEKEKIKGLLEKIYKRDFLWNFRDIAKFNTKAEPQKVFRTSSLISYQNENFILDFLNGNNIKTIIDLRAENEIEKDPYNNDFIKNFNYVKAPFDPWNQPEWFKETQHFGTNTEIAYRFFVLACKNEVKKVFETILNTDGAVAIHCLAGKDRTGFIIMLINMLIETPYEIMLADYLASELDAEENKFKIYYENIISEGSIKKYLKSCEITENMIRKIKLKLCKQKSN